MDDLSYPHHGSKPRKDNYIDVKHEQARDMENLDPEFNDHDEDIYAGFMNNPGKNKDFSVISPIEDHEYISKVDRHPKQKGSKSARRLAHKSIGGERSNNKNEFPSLKSGRTDRSVKSSRNKHDSEIRNSHNPSANKIRYGSLAQEDPTNDEHEKYKDFIKNFKGKEPKQSEEDYSAYLEDGHMNHQSSDDQHMIPDAHFASQPENKYRNKKINFKKVGSKQMFDMPLKRNDRNEKYRMKNNHSEIHQYDRDMINQADTSEEIDSYPSHYAGDIDQRRVQTEADNMPSPHKYPSKMHKLSNKEFLNPKSSKIERQIKKRRRSEQEQNPMYFDDRDGYRPDTNESSRRNLGKQYQYEESYNSRTPYTLDHYNEEIKGDEFDYLENMENFEENSDDIIGKSMQRVTESEEEYISDAEIDDLEEEDYQAKYAWGCNKKIDDDMDKLHQKNIEIRRAIQEIYENCEQEINELNQWKQTALEKLKNYKLVIKELMNEVEEIRKSKDEKISKLEKEIIQLKDEHKQVLERYNSEQETWEEEHDKFQNEIGELKHLLHAKEHQNQKTIMDYEGQIVDLQQEMNCMQNEKNNLVRKWKEEQEMYQKFQNELEIKD